MTYLKPGNTAQSQWLTQCGLRSEQESSSVWRQLPQAELVEFQSIDKFNSFLWKVWDEFGISQSRMIGYWVPNCPVKTGHPNVLATAYVRDGKTLVALASWAKDAVRCRLAVDWKTLGLEANKCRITAPAIANFQEAASYSIEEEIPVPPGRGWLLVLSEESSCDFSWDMVMRRSGTVPNGKNRAPSWNSVEECSLETKYPATKPRATKTPGVAFCVSP